jgi:uncharacterized BrkB/YihY/UPF0761 family membrane protein
MTTEDVGAVGSAAVPPAETTLENRGRVARLKAGKDRLTTRAIDTRQQLNAKRGQSEAIDTVFSVIERDTVTGGPVLAGAVAFRVFLFMVPYVFVLVAGLGVASDAAGDSPSELARKAGIGGLAAQSITDVGNLSFWSRTGALLIGGFALLIAARTVVKVLFIIHSLIWGIPVQKPKSTTRAAAVFVGIVTVGLAFATFVGWLRDRSFIGGLVGMVLFVLVPTGAWLVVSWFLPRASGTTWSSLLPGAVLFGVGTAFLHVFTVYWIAHQISTKSDRYGALGTALALLLWAFIFGRVIVAAATLNAARWRIAEHEASTNPINGLQGS